MTHDLHETGSGRAADATAAAAAPPAPRAGRLARPGRSTLPTVTVVIPCYNYGRFVGDAVASALDRQPGVDVSVLVIDDASSDGSGDTVEGLVEEDPRVEAILHEQNRGHIATYNEGLAAATTDYVTLLSADDQLAPGALSRATALLDANPSVGLAYGRPRNFSGDAAPPAVVRRQRWRIWNGLDWIGAQSRRGQSCIYSPEAVVRTQVQHQVGGYSTDLPHTADLEMWLRIAAVADVGHIDGPDQAFRRVHPQSMMQTSFTDDLVDIQHRRQAYEKFFAGLPDHHPASAHAETARRRLAEEALEDASGLLVKKVAASRDDVETYIHLAADLDAEVTASWQWRELEAWLGWRTDRRFFCYLPANALTARRRIEHRIRRQSWRLRGV